MRIPKPPKPRKNKWMIIRNISLYVFLFCSGFTFAVFMLNYNFNLKLVNANPETDIDNAKVYFERDTLSSLNDFYLAFDTEYLVCLYGFEDDGAYYINQIDDAKIVSVGANYVEHYPCDSKALMVLHNHRLSACWLSQTDIETYEKTINRNIYSKDMMTAVQCGKNTIGIFGYQDYKNKIDWGIYD